jgi:hypothetical protein
MEAILSPLYTASSTPDLVALAQRVGDLADAVARQAAAIDRLDSRLADLGARSEWHDVQSAQMVRVIATAMRQIRETQVYSMLSEGPLDAQSLRELLQAAALDPLPAILNADERDDRQA